MRFFYPWDTPYNISHALTCGAPRRTSHGIYGSSIGLPIDGLTYQMHHKARAATGGSLLGLLQSQPLKEPLGLVAYHMYFEVGAI